MVLNHVFASVQTLERDASGRVTVGVTYASNPSEAETIVRSLKAFGGQVAVQVVAAASLPSKLTPKSVVYVGNAVAPGPIAEACRAKHALSITAVPLLVHSGLVSLAVGTSGAGRPEILVHAARLSAEGQALPSNLLAMSKVIE